MRGENSLEVGAQTHFRELAANSRDLASLLSNLDGRVLERGDTLARLELLLENLKEQRRALDTGQKSAATAAGASAVNDEAIIALQNDLKDGSAKLWLEFATINATQKQTSDLTVDIVKKNSRNPKQS